MSEPLISQNEFVAATERLNDPYLLPPRTVPMLRQLLRLIYRALVTIQQRLERGSEVMQNLRDGGIAVEARVDDLEAAAGRARVVADLPANAPAGMLIVTPGDPNLYVGTGPATPLRRIPTQPL